MESHLITGATGLVGTHISLDLLSQNKKVCGTCTKNSNRKIIKPDFSHYGFLSYFDQMGFTIDSKTLNKSFRCSPTICDFISSQLGISIESHQKEHTKIIVVDDPKTIDTIHRDEKIVKLFFKEQRRKSR